MLGGEEVDVARVKSFFVPLDVSVRQEVRHKWETWNPGEGEQTEGIGAHIFMGSKWTLEKRQVTQDPRG